MQQKINQQIQSIKADMPILANEINFETIAQEILNLSKSNKNSCELKPAYFLAFKSREVENLPEPFKSHFKFGGNCAYIKKFLIGSTSYYEISFCRFGYSIKVSGYDLSELKKEFIQQAIEKYGDID